jgi:hypothetical protein
MKPNTLLSSSSIKYDSHRLKLLLGLSFPIVGEPGSSVSIASDYGLEDRAIEVRFLAGAKDFSSGVCVQTGSGAHPASCTMGTAGPFARAKARPGRDADHSPPSSAEAVNELELYFLSPKRLRGVYRDSCLF